MYFAVSFLLIDVMQEGNDVGTTVILKDEFRVVCRPAEMSDTFCKPHYYILALLNEYSDYINSDLMLLH